MSLPLTPVRFLQRARDLYTGSCAIVSGKQTFTYAEFAERSHRLASALLKAGLQPGDRVAFLSLNNHQLLEGYYGVPLARAVVMPLNVRLSPAELTQILAHSGASWLMYETDFAPVLPEFRAGCPELLHYIALDGQYEDLLANGSADLIEFEDMDENAAAELFYTSGSTGTPKGVLLSHRTLYLHGVNVATLYEDPANTVDLHTIPLFHANGWGRPHASVLLGIKQVMVRRFDPPQVLALIQQHSATDMSLVPTMANALLNVPNFDHHNVSSMRMIMIGGAASSPHLIQRMEQAFGCTVLAGYGLTETAPVLCTARSKPGVKTDTDSERWRRRSMTGWAAPGVEVRVVNDDLHDVARDGRAIGEVVARGDHIMSGYFRDEEATRAVMRGGWFHTGDMAVWDTDGYIQIVDRKKEIIVSGGENISSIEVENAISAHPQVLECAVVPAPDPKWGEVPAAIVVRKLGGLVTGDQLLAFLEGTLGRFKMPRVIEFREEALPKTGTGKIRKIELRERYWADKSRRVGE